MTRPRVPLLDRLLRALVRLLPGDFRSDFGEAIAADLEERREHGDRWGLVRRELPSLLRAVAREHATAIRMDAKYAFRTMRRTPGFTAVSILMLALGTGVNTAMFSVIDAVIVRTPFANTDQLVIVQVPFGPRGDFGSAVPVEKFDELARTPGPFAAIAALDSGPHILTGRGEPQQIDVECVSASMFDVLGTRPWLGRVFDASEDRAGAPPVMVLSYDFWRQLGGATALVGAPLTINQTPVTVIGVMPRGFLGAYSRSDVAAWLPRSRQIAGGGAAGCRASTLTDVFARLRNGLTVERTALSIPGVRLLSLQQQTFEEWHGPFSALSAAVGCVLLIACFNVGGLQLERTLARRRELALRLALGASQGRLVRQALTENLILALIGGAAGVAATALSLQTIVSLLPANLPHLNEIAVNPRVLAAALAIATIAGVVAGVFPILQTRRLAPGLDLAGAGRSTERRSAWTRRILVTIEIAASIVVLIGAALMVQTFLALRPTSPGFDPVNTTSILVRLPGATADESARFFTALFDRLSTTPGLERASGATYLPMWGTSRGVTWSFDDTRLTANTNYALPGYFELMKIPILSGRTFTTADRAASTPVVLVNEVFARKINPDGRVVGRRIGVRPAGRPNDPAVEREIIGVIGNTRSFGSTMTPERQAYIPYLQNPIPVMFAVAPAEPRDEIAVAAGLRAAVHALRPDLAIEDVGRTTAWMDRRVSRQRFNAWLLGSFAALAIGLTAIGLMTTIGWWVNQRTREMGVRRALGATPVHIARLVMSQGVALGASGIALGCGIAALATRYLASSMYGVTPLDARTFGACALSMLLIAAAAVYLPMRRATAVDPVVTLRVE